MGTPYVALDLETTGLDPDSDAIIEVGAVRFDVDGVHDTFNALIDPRRPIPRAVQTLTGITNGDVRDASTIGAIADEIETFLRDAILVGHNVAGFDAVFLRAAGIAYSESIYDTQVLAELLLPGLSDYGLAALAAHFDVPLEGHHRAGADAEAARLLFLALQERGASLPANLLSRIAEWLTPTAWPWRGFFRECWEVAATRDSREAFASRRPPRLPEPLVPAAESRPVPVEEPLAVLRSARGHPEVLQEFEDRQEQQAMVAAVARALNEEQQLIVEAGTGTGKSLAYLVPAACYAMSNNERVLVSTATINLQDQLAKKDIPAVEALLPGGELRSCQLKGRRNYLCLKRFDALSSSAALSDDEALMAARVLIWYNETQTGDRAELRISQTEESVWREISADGAECSAENSPFVADGSCFLQRARRQAAASHIVVVNHSLLLSDAAMGGAVLPPYAHLVVDEAHHLEEEATRQFGFSANEGGVADLFDRCERLAGHVQSAIRGGDTQPSMLDIVRALRDAAASARDRHTQFFGAMTAFLGQQVEGGSELDDRLLLNRGMRVQADWPEVEIAWENFHLALQSMLSALKGLRTALGESSAISQPTPELILAETDALLEDAMEACAGLGAAIAEEDPQRVVWVERTRNDGTLTIAWAPLVVSDLLKEKLYAERRTLVLTAATLRTGAGFGYLQERLGLEHAQTLALGSPFDFKRAALVVTPRDMPEPGHPDYAEALARTIADLARAANGRTLALFTSHASLRTTHRTVQELLEDDGITVLGQGIDGSARQLVRALQSNSKTVLLGTASFWEGVDIAGEALSLLIIARLPFNVPTEPVFAARSALYDSPFDEYALPQAILRFRQGFGRLIRTKTDKGVLVVLDQRIVSKSYGEAFLGSLPGCPVRQAMLREMPDMVEQWLVSPVSGQQSLASAP